MKKQTLLLFAFMLSQATFAQKHLSDYPQTFRDAAPEITNAQKMYAPEKLKTIKNLGVCLDFTQTKISGHEVKQFLRMYNISEEKWDTEGDNEMRVRFANEFNDNMLNSPIAMFTDSIYDYNVKVCFRDITAKGGSDAYYLIVENATGQVVAQYHYKSSQASIGWIANLIGDGLENAGKFVAKQLKTSLKGARK